MPDEQQRPVPSHWTRSVGNVLDARSETSILSACTLCLTLQDRCFAVWDTQLRRTRVSRWSAPPLNYVLRRNRSSAPRGDRTIERRSIMAVRSPSPEWWRVEHSAHVPELVQATRDAEP